ncbi:MAG: NAD-dependent DNA ligase LigA [Chitinophagaceae bacterium]|nr:NAD-dependent DNA ligase LigA [Chitinophagaceae bacterium]
MYTNEDEAHLLAQAKKHLTQAVSANDIGQLRAILEYADWKYYVRDNPVLADVEYDTLFKKLKQLEELHPELVTVDSPTQRVAKGLNKNFPTVTHLVPMLSLENSYNADDLLDWDRKCKELSGESNLDYCVEPKFDGASISLVYENNQLVRAATRGNGTEGDDITLNAKQIRSIPLKANISLLGMKQIELRGEVLITKKRFEDYNNKLIENNEQPLANARNAASGSLRIKDPNEVAKRNLDAFLYHLSYTQRDENNANPPLLQTHYKTLTSLASLGFKTSVDYTKTFPSIEEVINYVHEFETKRDELPYEIDGMVIKVNRLDFQDKIGQTSHHPRWAIAFKFKARQATSKLLHIDYQVGRTGSITPVAKIEPVTVGGVTISSISLFNEDVIREKDLKLGDTILVERAGDVIPYIVKSFPEIRTGNEQDIVFPLICPVCNETLYKPENEAVTRCTNINCEAQVVERIIHFTSKDAMDIRGLGDALVRRFYELGFLKNILGIYHLPFERMHGLEGFGEKSISNLKDAIEKSKQQPLPRLIFGLGIRYVGETTAKALARTVSHLSDLYSKSKEELLQIEDVGEKVATSIVEFFTHHDNRTMLDALEQEGLCLENKQKAEQQHGGLQGKTFLFTGTLTMKRNEAEAMVELEGGSILGSVSSKLNYLVVGEDAGSKLEKAKKLGSVHILSEAEFLQMFQKD